MTNGSSRIFENQKQPFADLGLLLYKKETPTKVFPCQYCEIFKNYFFTERFWWLLLEKIPRKISMVESIFCSGVLGIFQIFTEYCILNIFQCDLCQEFGTCFSNWTGKIIFTKLTGLEGVIQTDVLKICLLEMKCTLLHEDTGTIKEAVIRRYSSK